MEAPMTTKIKNNNLYKISHGRGFTSEQVEEWEKSNIVVVHGKTKSLANKRFWLLCFRLFLQ